MFQDQVNKLRIGKFRIARDNNTRTFLEDCIQKKAAPSSMIFIDIPFLEVINDLLNNHYNIDYGVIWHDDVFPPFDAESKLESAINNLNLFLGEDSWGCASNAGINAFTNLPIIFLWDPHPQNQVIPTKPRTPILAKHIDGNTLLINLKALRKRGIQMPTQTEMPKFQLYDLVLTLICWNASLAVCVEPNLFAVHISKGSQASFDSATKNAVFLNFVKDLFSDEVFFTLNGPVATFNSDTPANKSTLQEKINSFINYYNNSSNQRNKLTIICRTQDKRKAQLTRALETFGQTARLISHETQVLLIYHSTEEINKKRYKEISNLVYPAKLVVEWLCENIISNSNQFPRVLGIQKATQYLDKDQKNETNTRHFAIFCDDDDFLFPPVIARLFNIASFYTKSILFNARVFEEQCSEDKILSSIPKHAINTEKYERSFFVENCVPICCIIYHIPDLNLAVQKIAINTDFYEDYSLILNTLINRYHMHISAEGVGISFHGKNTVTSLDRTIWNISRATVLSSFINDQGGCPQIFGNVARELVQTTHYQGKRTGLYAVFSDKFVQKLLSIKLVYILQKIGLLSLCGRLLQRALL